MTSRQQQAQQLQQQWETDPRWKGIKRSYSAEDVVRLRGSLPVEHTLAKRGAEKLWESVNNEPFVNSLAILSKRWMDTLPPDLQKIVYDDGNKVTAEITPFVKEFWIAQNKVWKDNGGVTTKLPQSAHPPSLSCSPRVKVVARNTACSNEICDEGIISR